MYINLPYLLDKGLNLEDLLILQLAYQARSEDTSSYLGTLEYKHLVDAGLLKLNKAKNKKQKEAERVRLTTKGKDILETLQIPDVIDDDIVLFNWLKGIYLERGKELGNQKKTKRLIAQFRVESGIEKNCLAHLLSVFVSDENNLEYNHRLEYAFFKPSNAFQTRFELEQSRLWMYYQRNLDYFTRKFQELTK